MLFYGLMTTQVKALCPKQGKYYVLRLGEKIEVTSIKRLNTNTVLSGSLSSNKVEDKLMIKYYPNNIIYFDEELIEGYATLSSVSCEVDKETYTVKVGRQGKYSVNQGVLALSGVLSANGLVERQRAILSNSQVQSKVRGRVRVLSVGVAGSDLFGLFLARNERGIAVSLDDSDSLALSVKNLQVRDCSDWAKSYIEDWFVGCKVAVKPEISVQESCTRKSSATPTDLKSLLSILTEEDAHADDAVAERDAIQGESVAEHTVNDMHSLEDVKYDELDNCFSDEPVSLSAEEELRRRRAELAQYGELRLAVML